MNEITTLHGLMPILPELVLALGALVLLMIGAAGGERNSGFVNGLAILVLVGAGGVLLALPAGRYTMFGGSFVLDDYARFSENSGACRLGRRAAAVAGLSQDREAAEVRIRHAVSALDARHDAADFGG